MTKVRANRINEPKILGVGTGVRNGPFTEVSLKVPDAVYKQSVEDRCGSGPAVGVAPRFGVL
jgi:hypothetical protein